MAFLTIMEWIGTIAFAVSGALVAIEKKLDYYGILFMAIITAIGGGILRDVLVNKDLPLSLHNPSYAIVSILSAAFVIAFYNLIKKIYNIVAIADGIGLAAFTAIGAKVAVVNGYNYIFAIITMAVLTGTFGGVARDVFVNEIPFCFRKEVYAVASIIGGTSFYFIYNHIGLTAAIYLSFAITLVIRLTAIIKDWNLGVVDIDKHKK